MDDYKAFELSDGARLAYLDQGAGETIVMLAGWSQSVAQYKHQLGPFSENHRVVAVDWRGHGRSSKPETGYRLVRFAADLREFIAGLRLRDVTILAHSTGAAAVWSYLDSYGTEGIKRLVFVDKGASETARPDWDKDEADLRGASIATLPDLATFYENVLRSTSLPAAVELIRRLFTPSYPPEELEWAASENLLLPRPHAAALLWDAAITDLSDVFDKIDVPALVVGAERSLYTADSQRWIANKLPRGQVEIFGADEGGSHFMFMENPTRFNEVVLEFLASS